MKADVLIIGGGVIGAAIAREISKYDLKIILLEKEDDIAMGTSKANSGIIHAGYNAKSDTLKGRLNVQANPIFDGLCEELNVPFKRIGSLVIGFTEEDLRILKREKENGEKLGIKGMKIISGNDLFDLEPNLNRDARFALYAPTAGIISSYEFAIALADSAVLNGTKVYLETEVLDVLTEDGQVVGVKTNQGLFQAKVVINAAGVYADKIASMAGDNSIKIKPYKGEYHLLDKKWGDYVKHVLFPIPDEQSKGILVTPTVHGNLLIGPNSNIVGDKDDLAVSSEGLEEIYREASKMVPGINRRDVIANFAGLRAKAEGDDFIIAHSREVKGLINVAGIQSPGLTAAPAIAKLVVELLRDYQVKDNGIELREKEDFQASLAKHPVFTEASIEEWNELIRKDPTYGEIICRCEKVSKGEILDALRRPVPAGSLDAIKRRTRAGAGRCQGGFCGPRVLEIIAAESGLKATDITKKGKGSEILCTVAKGLSWEAGDGNETEL